MTSAEYSTAATQNSTTAVIKTVERPSVGISPQGDVSVRSTTKPGPGAGPVIDMGKVEKVTDRYPNGKIRVEREVGQDQKGNYVNQGNYKAFDQDGQVIMSGEFLNGKQNGKWTQRFTKDEGHLFFAGRRHRIHRPVHLRSHVPRRPTARPVDDQRRQLARSVIEWSFDNGTRSGNWTWWHPNGKKRLEAIFQNGMINGDVQEFDREEKQISKNTYIDGKILVKVTGWYTLGQKHYEGYYLKSRRYARSDLRLVELEGDDRRREARPRRSEARLMDLVVSQRRQADRSAIRPRHADRQVQVVV